MNFLTYFFLVNFVAASFFSSKKSLSATVSDSFEETSIIRSPKEARNQSKIQRKSILERLGEEKMKSLFGDICCIDDTATLPVSSIQEKKGYTLEYCRCDICVPDIPQSIILNEKGAVNDNDSDESISSSSDEESEIMDSHQCFGFQNLTSTKYFMLYIFLFAFCHFLISK